MSIALYYDDSGLLEFDATVVTVEAAKSGLHVILDRTAFYPEGGGQPADKGTLEGHKVEHVRKANGEIVHRLAPSGSDTALTPGVRVHGGVDPAHRRDYMQQHTGQHILSGALMQAGGFGTVSVHQGAEYTTIDIDTATITAEQLAEVERIANAIIEADVPVTTEVVHESQIASVPLRRPAKVQGEIRVVRIGAFDCVACGGVHCSRTGEVRLIRLYGVESVRGTTRLSWKIGDRSISHYAATSTIVADLVTQLSAQPDKLLPRVRQMEERVRTLEFEIKEFRKREAELVAQTLLTEPEPPDGRRVITASFTDKSADFLRGITELLVEQTKVCVCLTNRTDDRLYWSVGLSDGVGFPFEAVKKELLQHIDGKGGGRPPIWQGVGSPDGDVSRFLSEFQRMVEAG